MLFFGEWLPMLPSHAVYKVRQLGVPYQIATSNSESDDKIECHSTDSD